MFQGMPHLLKLHFPELYLGQFIQGSLFLPFISCPCKCPPSWLTYVTQVLDFSVFRKLQVHVTGALFHQCIRRCKPAATHAASQADSEAGCRRAASPQPLTAPGCVTSPIQTLLTFSFRIDLLLVYTHNLRTRASTPALSAALGRKNQLTTVIKSGRRYYEMNTKDTEASENSKALNNLNHKVTGRTDFFYLVRPQPNDYHF